ncbi:MAG: ABC transporter substrate-binding protein [Propionibacteriaceae bacterium]|jgi:peptide/nickel transport system substrate-binding protein|nr:ABC transporter substrate-binding protein [Propionibacteriaceae bacterium]
MGLSNWRRPIQSIALVLAGVLALTSCAGAAGGGSTQGGQSQSGQAQHDLVVGATLEPASMDPWHNTAASIPQVLLYNVYETLVKVDQDGKICPLLAREWEISADRTEYTFHLNPAAKFASGAPVDAAAVVANIDRLKADAKLTETLKLQLAVVDSATALDSQRVLVKLTRPSMMWLYDMSSTLGMMVDPAAASNGVDLSKQSAGSGPYTVSKHNQGVSVVLAKSATYWGTPARFDEVTFRYFGDPNAMNAAMLAGDLDVISNLQAPDALSQFSDTSRFTTLKGTTNGEVVMGLNNDNEALSKLEVRQALTMAIDRKALMDTVWNGQGTLIGSMAVPTDPWYEDLFNTYPYDPAKAKDLLKQAGYAKGLKLRFRVPVIPYAVNSAKFVASQLRDVGVDAEIEELEFSRWIPEVLTNGDYDMTIVAHVEARDLGKFADKNYYWHYGNPTFAKLYQEADEADQATGVELMRQAAKLLADDCAAIWLFALPNLVITKASVVGVPANQATLSFDLTTVASR